MMLVPAYNRLCARLGIRPQAAGNLEIETAETQAPHAQLRRSLQADPSMAALLPVAPGRLVVGTAADAPFFLTRTGLLRLPPGLLDDPTALAAATRWGLEASYLQSADLLTPEIVVGIALHGKALLRSVTTRTCDQLLENVPRHIAEELTDDECLAPSKSVLEWQRSRIEAVASTRPVSTQRDHLHSELWNSVEQLLVSGGDSRINIDRRTGFNRYFTMPRPRPEAVHFSSSTASCVSDYGFLYCDLLRHDLLSAMLREDLPLRQLRPRVVDAIAGEILDLLTLSEQDAGVVLSPSGTDTELLAVLVGLAAGGPLCNILISPEETGRGVREAGAGQYFDAKSSAGQPLDKGAPVWPDATIRTVDIPIRNEDAVPRSPASVAADVRTAIHAALARGERVLLHLLASSKTGLAYPTPDQIMELASVAPEAIDVVVDACQLRTSFVELAEWVRRGWMLQVTGSNSHGSCILGCANPAAPFPCPGEGDRATARPSAGRRL